MLLCDVSQVSEDSVGVLAVIMVAARGCGCLSPPKSVNLTLDKATGEVASPLESFFFFKHGELISSFLNVLC